MPAERERAAENPLACPPRRSQSCPSCRVRRNSSRLYDPEEPGMPKVIADITMSLDGYVAGPSADPRHAGVDELHVWVTDQDRVDTEILEHATAETGAVVMGRRLFDIVDGPDGWTEDMGYG